MPWLSFLGCLLSPLLGVSEVCILNCCRVITNLLSSPSAAQSAPPVRDPAIHDTA